MPGSRPFLSSLATLFLSGALLAGCGGTDEKSSKQATSREASAGGKVAWVDRYGDVNVFRGPSDISWPCDGVGQLAADAQFVYFVNSRGLGRARWDGSGSADCSWGPSVEKSAAVAAAGG